MMKIIIIFVVIIIGGVGYFVFINNNQIDIDRTTPIANLNKEPMSNIKINPISHASAVIEWDGNIIYTDPVGGADLYTNSPKPDIILITDIHGDHLDVDTLEDIVADDTVLIVPHAVAELLPAVPGKRPESLASRVVKLANGDLVPQLDFTIIAVSMYNIPESEDAFHTKGRGNGYIIEKDGLQVYVAGDTADIPEMRNLKEIDIALVPMNLPYTMDVETAADAVLAFKPKQVYPYHYRGPDGLSDVAKFKEIVNAGNPDIEVILLEWYPE